MTIPFIDLRAQYRALQPQIQDRINRVLEHGQYIMGPEVSELEEKLAAYTGSKHCITVASGTEALLVSLMALGIGPGDEVITTPFTFISTAEVIVLLGATPVYVDIEPDTCNIDASLIEAAITPKTRAIIPVSLYGQPADMDEINAIAARYANISVIEDAAQSFGAEYKGKKSCNLSRVGCTSFFPSKPLGCYGDGGAIFSSDNDFAQACREIRIHGQSERYIHTRIGVGGRLDTIQAAILLAKLDTFDTEIDRRVMAAMEYDKQLDAIKIPHITVKTDRISVFGQYTIFIDNRDKVAINLSKAGIPTAVYYPLPINRQKAYLTDKFKEYNISDAKSRTVLSLPMSPWLKKEDIDAIVSAIQKSQIDKV